MIDMKPSGPWLDLSINDHLRKLVNDEGICHFDKAFKNAHTSICVMMDRVADSGSWLNDHSEFPTDNDAFILFLVHSDIVIKTILKVFKETGCDHPYSSRNSPAARQFLAPYCADSLINSDGSSMLDDSLAWSHLRALAFAHTEETGAKKDLYQNTFLLKGEIQYSPFPSIETYGNRVGVVVYSNIRESVSSFMLPHEALKRFVLSRFLLIGNIVEKAEKRVKARKQAHRREGLDESGGPIPTLRRMRDLYSQRFGQDYALFFDFPLVLLTCPTSRKVNDPIVAAFRNELSASVSNAAAAFRRGEYELCIRTLNDICDYIPNCIPHETNHPLQNAFAHLDPADDKRALAIDAVRELAKGFVGQYVTIDADTMSNEEIQLLLSVACWRYRKGNGFDHCLHSP